MRTRTLALALMLAAAAVLAGCAARGDEDPLAYMRKALYASSFDLERTQETPITQKFWVTDGSIAQIQVQVWVNATAGEARVLVKDPSGNVALSTTESTTSRYGLALGEWTVTVEGSVDAAGDVGIMVTRAASV